MTTSPRPQDRPQGTVGGYTLLSRIGEGGMGVVHLARRPGGHRVALKVLRPHIVGDDEARARFAREVTSLRRIRSRWVAEILDADPWAEVPYVATRYVPGLSLHDHVLEQGPITGADLIWFAACLAEGLSSVHEVGVLHRDVKPSNVLLEGRTPILIDFGLARVADDPKLTHPGWLLGTPGYLAPEILHGQDASAASDIHSWAATVAFAGMGRPPFGRGPSMAIMDRVRRGEHDLSGLDGDLREVVAAALDPDPVRRPTLAAILGWLRPQTTQVGAVVPPPPVADDSFTIPLALAPHPAPEDITDRIPTRLDRRDDGPTRLEQEWDERYVAPPPLRTPLAERARRALLLGAGAVVAGTAIAAYPWPALGVILLVVWVARSGSLAASAVGDRRRLRGRKWYDGAQFLIGTPWDLVRSIPGTLMLLLWSAGLAAAGALICYAAAATAATTLFASGVVLTVSLWGGPGGSRVRSPLSRVVNPVSRTPGRWLVALLVVLVLGSLLAYRASMSGTSWTPDDNRPFSGYDVRAGILGPTG